MVRSANAPPAMRRRRRRAPPLGSALCVVGLTPAAPASAPRRPGRRRRERAEQLDHERRAATRLENVLAANAPEALERVPARTDVVHRDPSRAKPGVQHQAVSALVAENRGALAVDARQPFTRLHEPIEQLLDVGPQGVRSRSAGLPVSGRLLAARMAFSLLGGGCAGRGTSRAPPSGEQARRPAPEETASATSE